FFMTHTDRVYSRSQLLDHVWGGSVYVEERTIDVHIRRLRKTLEPFGLDGMVQTVRGAGHRFSGAIDACPAPPPASSPGPIADTGAMPPEIYKAWSRTVAMLALLLALAALGGALAGHAWEALAVAALLVIGWHYWRLQRVLERLTARRRQPLPTRALGRGRGAWSELERLLHRSQVETRGRKTRLLE